MILKIAIGGICLSILQYLKNRFCYKNSKSYGQETRLPFKTVKNIYSVNYERWKYTTILISGDYECSDTTFGSSKVLLYNAHDFNNNEIYWPEGYYYKNDEINNAIRRDIIRVHLSYPDWLKLRFYYFFNRHPTKGTEIILKSAQRDIDKLRGFAKTN